MTTRGEITGLDVGARQGRRVTISHDGAFIVAAHQEEDEDPALYIRPAPESQWQRLLNTESGTDPTFSPDGEWIAFERGDGIWKIPVTGGTALPVTDVDRYEVQVSNAGGSRPLWSRDGTELFYLQAADAGLQLVSVAVPDPNADGDFDYGAREVVMDWPYYPGTEGRAYDVSLDGRRFLTVTQAANDAAELTVWVVTDWFEELLERMGG